MKKINRKTYRYDTPFDTSWNIRVFGRTQADGEVFTVTAQIIRDKLIYLLDKLVREGKLQGYNITAKRLGKK